MGFGFETQTLSLAESVALVVALLAIGLMLARLISMLIR